MTLLISRRRLLSSGLKTSVGLVVLRQLAFNSSSVVVSAQTTQAGKNRFQTAYQRLDEYIARHMAEVGAPGMTVALADRNGLLRASEYGFADVKAGSRVSPQTLFEIGSISKSFVAIAVLQLAEEGKIDLQKGYQLSAVAQDRLEVFAV